MEIIIKGGGQKLSLATPDKGLSFS